MKPSVYSIELTNKCNFDCGYCKRYFSDRKEGFMTMKTFKNSMKWLDNTLFLELHMNGESLLHPKFDEMVRMVREKVPFLGIATNGSLVDEHEETMMLFDEITVSLHQVKKLRIDCLKKFKGLIRFQILGEQIFPLFLEKWEDKSNVKLDSLPFIDYKEKKKNKQICIDSLVNVAIQWDGDVVPCCKCNTKNEVLANVNIDDVMELDGRYKVFDECKYCQFPNTYLFHMELLKEIVLYAENTYVASRKI